MADFATSAGLLRPEIKVRRDGVDGPVPTTQLHVVQAARQRFGRTRGGNFRAVGSDGERDGTARDSCQFGVRCERTIGETGIGDVTLHGPVESTGRGPAGRWLRPQLNQERQMDPGYTGVLWGSYRGLIGGAFSLLPSCPASGSRPALAFGKRVGSAWWASCKLTLGPGGAVRLPHMVSADAPLWE